MTFCRYEKDVAEYLVLIRINQMHCKLLVSLRVFVRKYLDVKRGTMAPPPFEKEGVSFNQLQHYYGLANLIINTLLAHEYLY